MDGGFIVYVRERLPIDEAEKSKILPEFANAIRQTRQQEAFNAWFSREIPKSMSDTPLATRGQRQPGAGGS